MLISKIIIHSFIIVITCQTLITRPKTRPKFSPRDQFGLETTTSLVASPASRTSHEHIAASIHRRRRRRHTAASQHHPLSRTSHDRRRSTAGHSPPTPAQVITSNHCDSAAGSCGIPHHTTSQWLRNAEQWWFYTWAGGAQASLNRG